MKGKCSQIKIMLRVKNKEVSNGIACPLVAFAVILHLWYQIINFLLLRKILRHLQRDIELFSYGLTTEPAN